MCTCFVFSDCLLSLCHIPADQRLRRHDGAITVLYVQVNNRFYDNAEILMVHRVGFFFFFSPPLSLISASLTLQDIDGGSIVSLLDDAAAFRQAGGIHAVHDGENLRSRADEFAAQMHEEEDECGGSVVTCPCSRCFMKSLFIKAFWISSPDLQTHSIVTSVRARGCVRSWCYFRSLFCLEIAGQHDVSELGGVQGRRFGRDGLSLGPQGLVQRGRCLDRRSFKTHPTRAFIHSVSYVCRATSQPRSSNGCWSS